MEREPKLWQEPNFGVAQPNNPVVGVSWYEAYAYCRWLWANWRNLLESQANRDTVVLTIRLPMELEWVCAAGGVCPEVRYPWDLPGKETTAIEEIIQRANIVESRMDSTTSVRAYPDGISPHGVMDLAGNVWEWQANFYDQSHEMMALRGGSWNDRQDSARVKGRIKSPCSGRHINVGFRVVLSSGV